MYVCVCRAVTERQIGEAVRAGVRTFKDLQRTLGVASECGQCAAAARQCLEQALRGSAPTADQRFCFIAPT